MENSHKFFRNHECKFFPCHKQPSEDKFNCLFCYCPLYHLGDKCLGKFEYIENTKVCTNCHLPHMPEYYDNIVAVLKKP